MSSITFVGIMLIGLTIATIIDIRELRIPNYLTVSLAIVGLGHSLIMKGIMGATEHLLALLIGLVVFFIPYLLGVLGAGDVKLMGALGAVMGIHFLFQASLLIILVGALISIILMLRRNGWKGVYEIMRYFTTCLWTGELSKFHSWMKKRPQDSYPYSIAISLGSVTTLWYIYPNFV